jgi:membrane-associated phospholipid phosphatase
MALAWVHVVAVAAWVPRYGFPAAEPLRLALEATGIFTVLLLAALAIRSLLGRLQLTGWRPRKDAVLDALYAGFLMGAVVTDYTWVKLLIPALNGRLWDVQFGAFDRILCFGLDPNIFVLAVLEGNHRWVGFGLDAVYNLWLYLGLLGCLVAMTSADARLRRGAAVSMAVLWLAGVWIYVALPAMGPALVDLDLWTQVRVVMPNSAGTERELLRNYLAVKSILAGTPLGVDPSYGVAAMPSLHVGVDVLLALWARRQARWWAWVWWILAGLTAIGAVATGWHYLVDVLAGVVLAGACWWAGVAVYDCSGRRDPDIDTAAPTV